MHYEVIDSLERDISMQIDATRPGFGVVHISRSSLVTSTYEAFELFLSLYSDYTDQWIMAPKRGAAAQQAAVAVSKKQRADDSEDVKSGKSTTNGDPNNYENSIIAYLTSAKALDEISPEEIVGEDKAKDIRYPHSDLSPFACLVSALLLSKPFSHRLGMRAIHTVMNAPYDFTTPKKVADAGGDDRWQALYDAHTLHKEKTSGQLRDLAAFIQESYPEDYDNDKLETFRAKAGGDLKKLEKQTSEIKGFAAKTAQLFFRRVQLHWDELFPFADDLALEADWSVFV